MVIRFCLILYKEGRGYSCKFYIRMLRRSKVVVIGIKCN